MGTNPSVRDWSARDRNALEDDAAVDESAEGADPTVDTETID
ncbi:hypothetical protein [Haloterrigena gelatinilytica]|nr:hypothetical protein [Haloterrigena gelatinilytica]